MHTLLTPKSLAQAIGVSESSLRRWVDSGAVPLTRTAGGHRRIAWADAMRFIRQSKQAVVRPEILGLRQPPSAEGDTPQDDGQRLFRALHTGHLEQARGIVFSLYLTGTPLTALFDGPIRFALGRIGELWHDDRRGILIEHRATDITLQILNQLRQTIPAAGADSPLAIGGSPEGDTYLIPSLMAAIVAADRGFREMNMGPQTPVELLAKAAAESKTRVVCLSLSVRPSDAVLREIGALSGALAGQGIPLVIGGRHAQLASSTARPGLHLVKSMAEFAAFLAGLAATKPESTQ